MMMMMNVFHPSPTKHPLKKIRNLNLFPTEGKRKAMEKTWHNMMHGMDVSKPGVSNSSMASHLDDLPIHRLNV